MNYMLSQNTNIELINSHSGLRDPFFGQNPPKWLPAVKKIVVPEPPYFGKFVAKTPPSGSQFVTLNLLSRTIKDILILVI